MTKQHYLFKKPHVFLLFKIIFERLKIEHRKIIIT